MARAIEILGTTTRTATADTALAEIATAALRRRHLAYLIEGGLPDLADAAVMSRAWR